MTKSKINKRGALIFVVALILGLFVIFNNFEKKTIDEVIAGVIIIIGGVVMNLIDFIKWIKYLKDIFVFGNEPEPDDIAQAQANSPGAIQAMATKGGKVFIQPTYSTKNLPKDKVESDRIPELIEDIHKSLSNEKLSTTLIKCIRLATLIGSKDDIFLLENEAYGFEKNKEKIKEENIPDYRVIDTEIRIQSTAPKGYSSIPFKLTLGQPIYQIEGWIDDYYSSSGEKEIYLKAPMTENFRKAFIKFFKKEPPKGDIPYIIKIGEIRKVVHGLKLRILQFLNEVEKSSRKRN